MYFLVHMIPKHFLQVTYVLLGFLTNIYHCLCIVYNFVIFVSVRDD